MTSKMKKNILVAMPFVIVSALMVLFATQINNDTSFLPSVLIDKPVPEFTLPAIEGIEDGTPGFDTSDLVGQVSVVNVFASWCIPCRAEHKYLVELGSRNIVALYGINQKDDAVNARSFLTELGNPYDKIGADFFGRISIEWGVYGVPETFVVNANGVITYKQIGALNDNSYYNGLLPAIEAAMQDGNAAMNDTRQPT